MKSDKNVKKRMEKFGYYVNCAFFFFFFFFFFFKIPKEYPFFGLKREEYKL